METRRRRSSMSDVVATDSDKSPTSAESIENESNKTEERKDVKKRRGRHTQDDSFQREVEKWEEFYDDMKSYLTDGTLSPRSQATVLKQADLFVLESNGVLYYIKPLRECTAMLKLPVVRTYKERMQVCRNIHLSTGDKTIHNRRDTMLELLGQQYYWKGQRRDVCQCIASCEICSLGLGGKRRAKPPGQKRDIRPSPQKHPRLALVPVTPVSEINTVSYLPPPTMDIHAPTCSPPSTTSSSTSLSSINFSITSASVVEAGNSNTSENTAPHISQQHQTQKDTHQNESINMTRNSSPLKKPRSFSGHGSAFTPVDPFANLYTIVEACLLNDSNGLTTVPQPSRANPELSIASEVTVLDNNGLQIFTTINEPSYYDNHTSGRNVSNGPSTKNISQSVMHSNLCLDDPTVSATPTSGGDDEQYVVQGSSSCDSRDSTLNSSSSVEPSIYQLLFQLPSVPNNTLCTAVMESMQMSLKNTVDPAQLSKVAGQSLISVFNFSSSTLQAIVCPSRGAAYITSLATILSKQGRLTTTTPLTQQTSSSPSVILHDAICDVGSPKALSSLLGACNWSLGTYKVPMTKEELCTAIASNKVTALLYRPLAYSENSTFLSLDTLSSICHSQSVSLIVDCCGMVGNSLFQITSTMKEMLTAGADLIMLPTTGHFQGPSHTCVLIGSTDLLAHNWQLLSHIQSDLPLPLFCSSYDIVGSVVAFKSLQVTSFKTEPMNI